jgi:DNA recombination protein RmuC
VKTEFGKFGDVLGKVKRQLGTASRTIDQAQTRTRVMERKLRTVQQLPESEAGTVLQLKADSGSGSPLNPEVMEEEDPEAGPFHRSEPE